MSQTKGSYRIKKRLMQDTFEVPKKLVLKLHEAGENELKVFLMLASFEGSDEYFTPDEIKEQLEKSGISTEDFSEAVAFLRGAGLIESSTSKKSEKVVETPKTRKVTSSKTTYTSKELAEAANKGAFKELVEYASRRLGKTFNTSELSTLYSFTDYLLLPSDVVMLVIEHCVSQGKGSLRYVEKLLIDFADKEINTYQKAEEYILNRKKYLSFEQEIRKMMGLGQRSLTTREKTILANIESWSMPQELITLAYEKTVEKTGNASMSYMHKILESWHNSGFTTVDEVSLGDKKPEDIKGKASFDPEEFFKTALEKNRK
ncbi:MAG: DnaD domain protein [Ruminococcaceae bacterium]|nr:DnaD domain protein [Oscillospiraceae bacterium]